MRGVRVVQGGAGREGLAGPRSNIGIPWVLGIPYLGLTLPSQCVILGRVSEEESVGVGLGAS